MARALGKGRCGHALENDSLQPDLGDPQQGEPDAVARHILQDVLDDDTFLLDFLYLGCCAYGQPSLESRLRLRLDPGVDEVGPIQLPTEVTEEEDAAPDERPPQDLDVPPHFSPRREFPFQ